MDNEDLLYQLLQRLNQLEITFASKIATVEEKVSGLKEELDSVKAIQQKQDDAINSNKLQMAGIIGLLSIFTATISVILQFAIKKYMGI